MPTKLCGRGNEESKSGQRPLSLEQILYVEASRSFVPSCLLSLWLGSVSRPMHTAVGVEAGWARVELKQCD